MNDLSHDTSARQSTLAKSSTPTAHADHDPHALTICQCADSTPKRLAKRVYVGADGQRQIDASDDLPYMCEFTPVRVESIDALHAELEAARARTDLCVIRGELLPDVKQPCRRLLHAKPDGAQPTLRDVPRSWLMLDLDSIPTPNDVDFTREPARCAEYARSLLPPEFRRAACVWHASGSAGFKTGIRLHLWFLLDRPLLGVECKAWLESASVKCDMSIFRAVQPHYTADPELVDMVDPMVARIGSLSGGAERVQVPAVLPNIDRVTHSTRAANNISTDDLEPPPSGAYDVWHTDEFHEREVARLETFLLTATDERKQACNDLGFALAPVVLRDAWNCRREPCGALQEAYDLVAENLTPHLERSGADVDKCLEQLHNGLEDRAPQVWHRLRSESRLAALVARMRSNRQSRALRAEASKVHARLASGISASPQA